MLNIFIIDIIFQICFTSQPQVGQPTADTKVIQKMLRIQKECSQPYDFYGQLTMSYKGIVCTSFMLKL